MATSVTQHQITASFNSVSYTLGTYLNGDSYIIAPSGFTLSATSPAQSTGRNGVMVNPATQSQGFDDRADSYSSGLNVTLPYSASVGDSIVISTSDGSYIGTPPANYDSLGRSYIQTAMVLTVVAAAPASAAFRPPYSGTVRTENLESAVDLTILPNLSSASVASIPTLSTQEARWAKLQLDFIYNPAGQSIRPKQHMNAYGGNAGRELGKAISRLALDDGTTTLKPLAYSIIQYGIDTYGSMVNANTYWPNNGGHDHGRKPAMVMAAVLLQSAGMKAQIKSWANTEKPANNDLIQDDWSWRWSTVAKTPIYGQDGSTADYWTNQLTGNGNKALRDPYDYIDGGPSPGATYDAIVSPPSLAWSVMGKHMVGFESTWNHPSLDRGNRTWNFGSWALPDPYENDGEGVQDGLGRYPGRHGNNYFNATYDSAFTESVFDAHVNETVFLPDIEPYGTKEANQVSITLTEFGRVDITDYPNFWDIYDDAEPPTNVPGVYPYLEGTTIRYTTDGTDPTVSSTLYTGPFNLSYTDADSDDYVTVKARAFKAGYDDSLVNTTWVRIRRFIRQGATSNSGDNSVTSRTVTLQEPATEGSIIVASAVVRTRSTTVSFEGTGWTYLVQHTSAPSSAIAYKTAEGGETSIVANQAASSQRMAAVAWEISGVGGVLETVVNTSELGASATKSSGTASQVSGATYPALAVWAGDDNGNSLGSGYLYSNSYTEVDDGITSPTDAFRCHIMSTFRTIEATETPETTITVDTANFRGVGALIVFEEVSASPPKTSRIRSALLL